MKSDDPKSTHGAQHNKAKVYACEQDIILKLEALNASSSHLGTDCEVIANTYM